MSDKLKKFDHLILVCGGSDCKSKGGGKKLEKKVAACVEDLGLADSTHIVRTDCNGFCDDAPIVALEPGNIWLRKATGKTVRKAIRKAFDRGQQP